MVLNAAAIDFSDARSSSTVMQASSCCLMAACSAAAFDAWRVVSTVKKPSLANFCASAPPTPHLTPTGRSLSSRVLPCASLVLRPSDCHFDVAPMTTTTGLPCVLAMGLRLLIYRRMILPRSGGGSNGTIHPVPGANSLRERQQWGW